MSRKIIYFIVVVFAFFTGCKINYTFTGTSISPEVKTFTVDFFPNNAPMFQPQLSQIFTEGLRDRIMNQTKLNIMRGGDLMFEGEITGYNSAPISVQNTDMASTNRLTISVKVKYTNNNDPKLSFDQVFTQYEDYDATQSLSSVEDDLMKKIVDKLTEDIFNKSLATW